jgi:hypothetical protein
MNRTGYGSSQTSGSSSHFSLQTTFREGEDMKKVLILAMAIVMCAGLAFAQDGGHIGLYSDVGYTDCNVDDSGALYTNVNVYVVHKDAVEGNTSEFAINRTWPTANPGTPDFGGNLTLGTIEGGIVITYVGCKALPHLLATWPQFIFGQAPVCTQGMEVVASPLVVSGSGQIEVVDCNSTIHFATGGILTVNGDESCPCSVATQESSWSRIKALYQ